MKTASPELRALIEGSRQYLMADLITFTLSDGSLLRYTTADRDLGAWSAVGPLIKRGPIRSVIGLEVDTLELTVYPSGSDLVGARPFLQALHAGRMDGATVLLERAFMPSWGDISLGLVWLFSGRVAEQQISRTEARLQVKSDLSRLDVKLPRDIYQATCRNTLFDAGCKLVKSGFAHPATVAGGSTASVLLCGLSQTDGYFSLGTVSFGSGPNAGLSRSVKRHVGGALTLAFPLPSPPNVGDAFVAYPGCDKRPGTCEDKFSNRANFSGEPFIPVPETAY